ncbi:MAG: hypothetical protein HOV80_13065 [Polyangiaceae bacterium]|nr:hypothetical protein [Polyangiaceae bacterium]
MIYGDPLETALVPYPSDRFTVIDRSTATQLRVSVSPETSGDTFVASYPLVTQRLNELDGFSTTGGIAVAFDGPIDGAAFAGDQGGTAFDALDPASFTTKDSPIVLVDVDHASPEVGRAVGLLPRYFAQAKDDIYLADEYSIVARPVVPLAPGRRYLFAVTKKLLAVDGRPVERSPAAQTLLADAPADDYARKVQDGLAIVEGSIGLKRDDIVIASLFTTTTQTSELERAAEALRAMPPPETTAEWTVESTSDSDARIRFRGRFRSPEMRSSAGTFVVQGGVPVPQNPNQDIEVFVAFSDRNVSGPRPVVIYQHGLGGDKDGSWGAAERLSSLGVAVVSIDSPEHGTRGAGAKGQLESVFAFFGVTVLASDPPAYEFDLAKARDNFRQMTVDQIELVRLLSEGSLDLLPVGAPDGIPDIDPSQILYIGHSFGSVQGASVFALAPEIRHATWNVGGDGLMLIMEDSILFGLLVDTIAPFGTTPGQLARFFSATQAIIDPGDPLNFAPRCLFDPPPGAGERSILLQEVINDGIVPNTSTEALARAARLTLMDPVRGVPGLVPSSGPLTANGPGGSTAVLTQFATMNGGEPATHGELYFAPEGRDQYVEFFRTALEAGVGTVVSPSP